METLSTETTVDNSAAANRTSNGFTVTATKTTPKQPSADITSTTDNAVKPEALPTMPMDLDSDAGDADDAASLDSEIEIFTGTICQISSR